MTPASSPKILFFYTELAQYFLDCVRELLKKGIEVHVVRYPVNNEAPFNFSNDTGIYLYDRKNYNETSLLEFVRHLKPSIIVCSGWIDKIYIRTCRNSDSNIVKILTMDNHWKGALKQYLACILSRFTLLPVFSFAWVAGAPQEAYAGKLGFSEQKILSGFYSADVSHFMALNKENEEKKSKSFPKKFIYVGRYYQFKGVTDLWQAFIEIQNDSPNEWELWCLGTGDIEPVKHEKIKHFGFVQPKDIVPFIADTGVFVLPSRKEPWGVVVHEFAAAGFPLILSDVVGAATEFLEDGKNGFSFPAGNVEELKLQLKKVMTLSQRELMVMGEISSELAQKITPEKWAKTLISVLNERTAIRQ